MPKLPYLLAHKSNFFKYRTVLIAGSTKIHTVTQSRHKHYKGRQRTTYTSKKSWLPAAFEQSQSAEVATSIMHHFLSREPHRRLWDKDKHTVPNTCDVLWCHLPDSGSTLGSSPAGHNNWSHRLGWLSTRQVRLPQVSVTVLGCGCHVMCDVAEEHITYWWKQWDHFFRVQ